MFLSFYPLLLASLLIGVDGWGFNGHALVASIAQSLLTNDSSTFVRNHLPWYTAGNISMLASWPDNILYPDTNPVDYLNWQWSKELHFVDTKDWSCSYDRQQDCNWTTGQRCVDGSIQNFTNRLADSQEDSVQREQALKFLVHFIGDAHQPLHAGFEGDRGGNSIHGKFFSKATNLHSLWDTGMIEHRISLDFQGQPALYLTYLISQMNTKYAQNVSDWISCPASDESRFLACASKWIAEDAQLNCDLVYRDEKEQPMSITTGFALGQTYYNTRIIVLEQRLIQGGARLAAVINKVVQMNKDDPQADETCYGFTLLIRVLFVQTVLVLTLLACTCQRRRREQQRRVHVQRDRKDYMVIA